MITGWPLRLSRVMKTQTPHTTIGYVPHDQYCEGYKAHIRGLRQEKYSLKPKMILKYGKIMVKLGKRQVSELSVSVFKTLSFL